MIVSTTLTGSEGLATLDEALASVRPHVDKCLVIWTGEGEAPAIPGATVHVWPWQGDYGAARNAALDLATAEGATWAVTLDSDERWEGADEIREAVVLHPTARTLYALDGRGSYWQPRAIRLPCPARWTGRTHESLPLDGPRLARASFVERQKTPDQLKAKAERDVVTLREVIADAPTEARWHYYLGDALSALGRWAEALDAFQRCADLRGWHEEGALACFRAGDILSSELGQHQAAIDVLSAGMARHAGMAELPWMAALACARMGRLGQAVYWARLAQVHGEGGADDGVALAHRVLLRIPKALREGPEELLFYLFRELGDHGRAAEMAAAIERRWGHVPSASAAA